MAILVQKKTVSFRAWLKTAKLFQSLVPGIVRTDWHWQVALALALALAVELSAAPSRILLLA